MKSREEKLADRVAKVFGAFLRPIAKLRKNPRRVMAAPRTTIERLKRDLEGSLERSFSRKPPEAFFSRMLDLLPVETEEQIRKRTLEGLDADRATIRKDPSGAALLALFDAADAVSPIAPMMALCHDLEAETVDVWSVASKFDAAERCRGEKRAVALLEAVPDLVERLYARHLRSVWAPSFLAQGAWPSSPPGSLGALVNQAAGRLNAYPGLVDADAGHIRNAVAHRHAKYLPGGGGSVDLLDPPAGWQATLILKEFNERLRALWHLSVTCLQKLRGVAFTEAMLRAGMLEAMPLLREALHGDARAMRELEARNPKARAEAQLVRRAPPPGTNLWFLPKPTIIGQAP